MGWGRDFYLNQLGYVGSGDVDGLLENHYHPDAVMITFDGIRRGHDQLRDYYVNTLKKMGRVTELRTEYFAETEDVIIFKAVITSEGRGTIHADNGLYIRDGKIYRHIALTLVPDADYDALETRWTD